MEILDFAEIAEEFARRVQQVIWCNAATIDRQGRPRSRILHPVWDGASGWITARPTSLKARHLARVPYLSLAYIADVANPVYVDCHVAWVADLVEKRRFWDFLAATPPPVGFDPATIFASVDDPGFGLLRLQPWRIEVATLPDSTRVWHAPTPG